MMKDQAIELTEAANVRRLPWMLAGELLNSMFCVLTVFGATFTLFLDELGLDKVRIGFVISLVPFCGMVAPFVARRVARFGFRRTFVLFWLLRKFAVAFLLLTPTVFSRYGLNAAFAWVATFIFAFASCRSIAETAFYPWWQEIIPDRIRGKFSAINSSVATIGELIAITAASYVMSRYTGLQPYMVLIGTGVLLGLGAVALYARGPGGAPLPREAAKTAQRDEMREALRDRNFLLSLGTLALIALGLSSFRSFIPLYAKEQVGLAAGTVVTLSMGASLGSLLFSYVWGWLADRIGSKPVMFLGFGLIFLLPISWFLVPRHQPWSAPLAMALSAFGGVANMAWVIGWARYLFVTAIPREKRTGYSAVYYAWSGLIGGSGPLLAGRLLQLASGFEGQIGGWAIDAYTPLFALSVLFLALGGLLLRRMRDDAAEPLGILVRKVWHRKVPMHRPSAVK